MNTGLIQVYTGDGKGKTTAAIGAAIRAAGCGKKVIFFQFLKFGNYICGEEKILKKINNIKFIKFNEPSPIFDKKIDIKKLKFNSKKHIYKAIEYINSGKYDVVILDELTHHFKYKTMKVKDFLKKIKNKPEYVEIIITGRYAPKTLLNNADLITDMKKIIHPYDRNIKSRKGIDY
ncbi:MAG: cob(I)yrinic acid a,c-diamide adenosyltransferase [Candidatus Goldbacteria bacterium]|nr:cob(I)yrinic acid a,c-diamide adenosyltransferase [Candidatus Goldiibacteriota bacterium]